MFLRSLLAAVPARRLASGTSGHTLAASILGTSSVLSAVSNAIRAPNTHHRSQERAQHAYGPKYPDDWIPASQRKELLDGVEQLDAAIATQDPAALASLFATDAVVHQDGVYLDEEVWGVDSIVDWFKSQWDRYDCKHEPLLAGSSDHVPANFSGCAFSFWQDKDMRVKADKAKDLPNEAKETETTVGIWHPVFDHRLAIKHLYFMRQLPPDVAASKLRKPPMRTPPMDPASLTSEPLIMGVKRTTRQLEMDVWAYNEMWQNADPDLVDVCMAPDVQVWQPLIENSFIGADKYREQVEDHYAKVWQPEGQYSHVAVTNGNVAFSFWMSFGKDKPTGGKGQLFGLSLLGVRGDGKVQRLVEFRQLTSIEEAELVKEPYQSHRWDQ